MIFFNFLILDNDHKSFDNPIQKEKLKKIMKFMRYEGFSILSPWCYYQKFKFVKGQSLYNTMAKKSSTLHLSHGDKAKQLRY